MADAINFPGTVEWSGENPGISLKETPDGPFVTLASFFRVVLSPHGRGHALVLMQSPQDANAAGRELLPPRQREARALPGQRLRRAFRRLEGLAGMEEPDLPAARQRRGLRRSGEHLPRDGQVRRSRPCSSPGAGSARRSASRCRRTSRRPASIRCRACSSAAGMRASRSTARRCPASRCRARSPATRSPPRCWRSRRRGFVLRRRARRRSARARSPGSKARSSG